MASKRLSIEDIQKMKNMVSKGVAPEDISNHFGIAISSVHNYKNRFKQEGMVFPAIRGKRPTGSVEATASSKEPIKQPAQVNKPVNNKSQITLEPSAQAFDIVVNGVTVHISNEAKDVSVTKKGIEVRI